VPAHLGGPEQRAIKRVFFDICAVCTQNVK